MGLTATARSIPGTLRQDVVADGRFHIATDEPRLFGGDDTAPGSTRAAPASLASCVSTTLVMYARTKDWELGQVVVDVEYDNTSTPRRCEIDVRIERPLTAEQLARLEKVAATCPVRRAIESGRLPVTDGNGVATRHPAPTAKQ
jgi:putative redox protein